MNREEFVTYEQAVDLNYLGFYEKVNHYYARSNNGRFLEVGECCAYNEDSADLISAPTLFQVQKWFIKKEIYIEYHHTENNKWKFTIGVASDNSYSSVSDAIYNSPEQAISAGISTAIQFLNNYIK